jgi:hypothetical protein
MVNGEPFNQSIIHTCVSNMGHLQAGGHFLTTWWVLKQQALRPTS